MATPHKAAAQERRLWVFVIARGRLFILGKAALDSYGDLWRDDGRADIRLHDAVSIPYWVLDTEPLRDGLAKLVKQFPLASLGPNDL